jgi:hypothetical protein
MNRLFTADELAKRWSTSRNYLANLRSQGKGCPYIKLNRRVMYRESDVRRYESDRLVATVFVRPRTQAAR